MRAYYHLMGKVEMSRKNYSLAVDLFQQGVKLLPPQGLPSWPCLQGLGAHGAMVAPNVFNDRLQLLCCASLIIRSSPLPQLV